MQATKARNILEHADEIQSRPARTWMVSEQQKKRVKGTHSAIRRERWG
jgi:hypothetical protein